MRPAMPPSVTNNRDRLIAAAADLFHQKGYASTSLEDILKVTGVARSNFYYHFRSKLLLAKAVVNHQVDSTEAEVVGPALGDLGLLPLERIGAMFHRAAEAQDPETQRSGCPLGRLSTDLACVDESIRTVLEWYFTAVEKRVAALLVEADPSLSLDRARELSEIVVSAFEGGLMLSGLRRNPDYLRVMGNNLTQTVLERELVRA